MKTRAQNDKKMWQITFTRENVNFHITWKSITSQAESLTQNRTQCYYYLSTSLKTLLIYSNFLSDMPGLAARTATKSLRSCLFLYNLLAFFDRKYINSILKTVTAGQDTNVTPVETILDLNTLYSYKPQILTPKKYMQRSRSS